MQQMKATIYWKCFSVSNINDTLGMSVLIWSWIFLKFFEVYKKIASCLNLKRVVNDWRVLRAPPFLFIYTVENWIYKEVLIFHLISYWIITSYFTRNCLAIYSLVSVMVSEQKKHCSASMYYFKDIKMYLLTHLYALSTFEKVQRNKLAKTIEKNGIDKGDINFIFNLYWNQTVTVRVNNKLTKSTEILRGVHQGCILSPLLFNIYAAEIPRQVFIDEEIDS